MTQEQFSNTAFRKGMQAKIGKDFLPITAVDFSECAIEVKDKYGNYKWHKIAKVELLTI